MTRITPEIVERIEVLITCIEDSGQRAAMIEFNVSELMQISGFVCVLRKLGVDVHSRKSGAMSPQDRKDFVEFLRAKKAAAEQRP